MRFGFQIAKEVGRLGIGQAVVVKNRVVLAVEAVDGTDAAIRRGGDLVGGGIVVVKVSKPQQDLRFDVPTVGMETIRTIYESKGAVLAVEADKTIVLEQEELVIQADRWGIAVVAVGQQAIQDGKAR